MKSRARLAYVLCAGVGRRLQPLTARLPKALLPVAGRPMVFHVIDALRVAGVRRFVVNLHAHSEKLRRALSRYGRRSGLSFVFLREPVLLGGGGAILNAERHLTEPFWLVNGDFLAGRFPFRRMEEDHVRSGCVATLAVRPMRSGEPFNPVGVGAGRRLVRVSGVFGRGGRDHVFLGVHRIDPAALQYLSRGHKIMQIFSGLYKNIAAAGVPVSCHIAGVPPLPDPGTIEGYFNANFAAGI